MLNKIIKRFLGCSAVVMALAVPVASHAGVVPITLFNTGVNSSGLGLGGLAVGGADTHYDITTVTPAPIVISNAAYLANTALSQWIWVDNLRATTSATYSFTTTFDLSGLDLDAAVINGRWATDNLGVSITLNSTPTSFTIPTNLATNFNTWHDFSITDGFVSGINTLTFTVTNLDGPGGFRAELAGSSVPEPGSMALVGLALAGLGLVRRRKSI